jgi:hypothetical protein
MAYHRDHVKRFLDRVDLASGKSKAIEDRVESAILHSGDKKHGIFSGGKLPEVLGDPDLELKFYDMWEKGELHP